MKRLLAGAALACALASAAPASAQEYLLGASAQVASGMESDGKGLGRARTRLKVAMDLRVDEFPNEGIIAGGVIDLEPHAAFGADVRYMHLLGTHLAVNAGGIAYFAPGTLFGAAAGLDVRVPLSPSIALTVGPDVTVFPAGSDLPDGRIFWQVLGQLGVRFGL